MIENRNINVFFNRDSFFVLRIALLLKFLIVCFSKSSLVAKVILACLFKFLIVFFLSRRVVPLG